MDLQRTIASLPAVGDISIDKLLSQIVMAINAVSLFFILIVILFILQRLVFALSLRLFGGKAIYISAWIGTPIHELSHAFFCLIFGHKIRRILLFSPDQKGTLGYVTHSYNNRNLWQIMGNFFIGIAPLFGGLLSLYIVSWCLLDNAGELFLLLQSGLSDGISKLQYENSLKLTSAVLEVIEQAYINEPIKVIVWGYCCAAISLHLSPSAEDLKGISGGLLVFVLLCILLMLSNQFLQLPWFAQVGRMLNIASVFYLIGIVLASLLLLPLAIGYLFFLGYRFR